jgi:hypothetical protein
VALALTDEQREVIYQGVMRFPDAMGRGERPPELAEELSGDEPLQDLPASVTAEAPLLSAYVHETGRSYSVDRAGGPRGRGDDPALQVVAVIPRARGKD